MRVTCADGKSAAGPCALMSVNGGLNKRSGTPVVHIARPVAQASECATWMSEPLLCKNQSSLNSRQHLWTGESNDWYFA